MVLNQVEDVIKKFVYLDKLRSNDFNKLSLDHSIIQQNSLRYTHNQNNQNNIIFNPNQLI